ncbi:FtsX-like permease family protein [Agromyces archimandritae]|uniref:ABC3 transporter permease C-terminal domain-containing protein n=1 Tax=Agromyces archimandritae TaxID=2781962 RepID=A0A975FLG6_9MICO|nr:FtsX-like permease family protein [Agromyces archimandritae]QTX03917.1 hypothetical protein G127AT_11450 [Agromyces archimandritae]
MTLTDTRLLARHLRSRVLAPAALALLVAVACALAVAAPRWAAAVHDDALRARLEAAPARTLDVTARTNDRLPGDTDALAAVAERMDRIRAELPEPLRGVLRDARAAESAGPYPVALADPAASGASYRVLPTFVGGIRDEVRFDEGRAPAPVERVDAGDTIDVALSTTAAGQMDWEVGEVRRLELPSGGHGIRLSGTWSPVDTDADVWSHVLSALQANVVEGLAAPEYTATVLLDETSWPAFIDLPGAVELTAWYPVDPAAVTAGEGPALIRQLGEFTSVAQSLGPGSASNGLYFLVSGVEFESGLGQALRQAGDAAAAMDAVLAMTASGPIGVVVAVLVLGARVVFAGRRSALELAAARGASPAVLRTVLAVDGLAIGVPAALVGGLAGLAATPVDVGPAGWILVAVFALTPAALLVSRTGSLSPLRRGRSDLGGPAGARTGRARWVAELLLVVIAVAAAVLLLQRGLQTGAADHGVDLLVAAVPLLAALAVCVVVLRLYPVPLRRLARAAARGRGLVAALGSTRALRDPGAGLAPVLALVVGVAVAVFSGVLLSTVQAGVERASAERVGAELRIEGPALPAATVDAVRAADGVRAIAPVYAVSPTRMGAEGRNTTTNVVVVDVAELAAVQAGFAGRLELPAALTASEDEAGGLPALVSGAVDAFLGGADDARLDGHPLAVVGVHDGVVPFTDRPSWVLIDRADADGIVSTLVPDTILVALDPDADADEVAARLAPLVPDSTISTPEGRSEALRANPTIDGVTVALVAAIVLTSILCAIAVALTLVIGRAPRERLLTVLGTLGIRRRESRALVMWEIAPVAVVAAVFGGLLGAGLPFIVLAGVDLTPFTGGTVQPQVAADPLIMAGVLGAFVVAVAAATWIAVRFTRRAGLAHALREEEEG